MIVLTYLRSAALVLLASGAAMAAAPAEELYLVTLPAIMPLRVAYGFVPRPADLQVVIEATGTVPDSGTFAVELGMAAAKSVRLDQARAVTERRGTVTRCTFTVPVADLGGGAAALDEFQMAFRLSWLTAAGRPVWHERFLCRDTRAPHAPLPPEPQAWTKLSLGEYQAQAAEARASLRLAVNQPLEGKLSVVIDDAAGHRVRNLVSAKPVAAGAVTLPWDGLDEDGQLVAPGAYTWHAVSHAGIRPEYLFSFYNHGRPPFRAGTGASNWGADHSDPIAAASFEGRVYMGSPVAESGHNIIQLTTDGVKTAHGDIPPHVGQGKLLLVADATGFYALTEGKSWYVDPEKTGDNTWRADRPLSLMHWNTDGVLQRYAGPRGEHVVARNPFTFTADNPKKVHIPPAENLAGAALRDGVLFVSLAHEKRVAAVNPATGAALFDIALENPGLLAAGPTGVFAFSGAEVVRLDPNARIAAVLFRPVLSGAPAGLAVSAAEEIFVADNGPDQNVKVFSVKGTLTREIGRRGGRPLMGKWVSDGLRAPHGVTLDNAGQLWIAETDTWPRRISAWDAANGGLRRELFGPCFYGAPGGSFDPQDHTRWIGAGCLWQLDFAAKSARPLASLFRQTKPGQMQTAVHERSFNFVRREGRTFLVSQSNYASVYELRADGSAKLWAVCGAVSAFAQYPRWTLPKVFGELPAYRDRLAPFVATVTGEFRDRFDIRPPDMIHGPGPVLDLPPFLWVDRNNDDLAQAEEFEVTAADTRLNVGYWGPANPGLDLVLLGAMGGRPVRVALAPQGFLPNGAPDYRLTAAFAAATPITAPFRDAQSSIQDRQGRFITNSDPLSAFAADGTRLWRYRNQWHGVHGSHDAPLPEPGVLQGILWFLGTAPFDDRGEVMLLNGNHGRFFLFTTDGIYLDEMFKDVRVTRETDAYMIGGECFGGYFSRGEDGAYYLQSGHTDYRAFRINGIETARRAEGRLTVTPAQLAAAQSALERRVARVAKPRVLRVTDLAAGAPAPGSDPEAWPGPWQAEWGEARREFPYAKAKLLRAGESLYLAFAVKDPSPWLNRGGDWTQLFKTGDSVDLQFSTDPAATPDRRVPVPGDRRLLLAPFKDKPLAVLYAHREPGTPAAERVVFSSPWRTETVDRVTQLTQARIEVKTRGGGYTLVAVLPLRDLGLPAGGQAADLKADVGVIYGDDSGSINLLRAYWANQATGLVNDVPGEIMLNPALWGRLQLGGAQP